MTTRGGVAAVWLAVVLCGGWAAAQAPEAARPERMTLDELLRLQQVVDEVLRGGGDEAAAPQPQEDEPRPPASGVGDMFPPPQADPAAAGAGRPEPDAVVEGVGVDVFLEPSAPAAGAPGGSPVAGPAAEPDVPAAQPGVGAAAGAQGPGDGSASEAAAGQGWDGVPAMAAPAPAPPLMPPDRGGLRLGRDGHPVVLRPPSPAYLRRVPRGTLGYRAPLVVKQRVGPMVVGGVYVPAHDAWVVLRDGHWELVGETATVPGPSSRVIREAPAVAGEKEQDARRGFWSRLLGRIGPAPGQGE